MDPSREIALYGTGEPVAAMPRLRAGPLECRLDGGNLRAVRIAGVEAVRAISFILRDRDWGTYEPEIADLAVDTGDRGFEVRYRARCADRHQAVVYEARIRGRADGSLRFEVEAVAETDFLTNRTGFVVLHPIAGVAGAEVIVEDTVGRTTRSRFPEAIAPWCPFTDIRAITHQPVPGLRVTCRMTGDAYETEDQRNWTDASFKTYIRPLAKPWPYRLEAGERLRQSVVLEWSGRPPGVVSAASREAVTVALGGPRRRRVPPLGLAVLPEQTGPALRRADPLRRAALDHLSCRFDPRLGHDAAVLRGYRELGRALGTRLLLEAVVPCLDGEGRPTDDPAVLGRDLEGIAAAIAASGAAFDAIAITPACDMKCVLPGSPFPPAPAFEALAAAARRILPPVPLGGGAFAFFTELNRKRPPPGLFDFVGHYTCPIFHAGDDRSLMETLEALPAVFATARAFLGRSRYHLYPTSIVLRENPYGEAPAANPDNRRRAMSAVDPRERALIGAAWYAGYLARAVEAEGPDLLTMAAPVGPAGIVLCGDSGTQPWFDEADALVYPKYHVLRGFARLAGAPLLALASEAPTRVLGFAAAAATGPELWLANLRPEPVTIVPEGLGERPAVTRLDETSFALACRDPERFDTRSEPVATGTVELRPYAVARLRAG